MENKEIYFSIYSDIEKEVLELSKAIYFTDDHLCVYSVKIADLIIRCSVELESIAKELYRIKNGEKCNTSGEYFMWLDKHFKISQKEILITSPYFHFNKYKNVGFCPFDYIKNSDDDYYSVYCSLKHDRIKNLYKATIYILIRVLGALYILNMYYFNKKINLGTEKYRQNIDNKGDSSIFLHKIAPCTDTVIFDSDKDILPDSCIYKITRKEHEYAIRINYIDLFDENKEVKVVTINKEFQNYVKNNLGKAITEEQLFSLFNYNWCQSKESLKEYFYNTNRIKKINEIMLVKIKSSYWLTLNE